MSSNSDAESCALLCVIVIGALIVSAIVYLGGGWLAKDIYFHLVSDLGNKTLLQIEQLEINVYNIVAAAYSCICLMIVYHDEFDEQWETYVSIGIPIACIFVLVIFDSLLLSIGAVILNTILCIVAMTIVTVEVIFKFLD